MTLTERLDQAHTAGDIAELIRLVNMLAIRITNGDQEAAEAAVDEIVMALVKGAAINNFPAWARIVIRRTAAKMWADRRIRDISLNQVENESFKDSLEAMLDGLDRERAEDMRDVGCWTLSRFEHFEGYFPSPDAVRAFRMQADGKSTAEIAAEFGVAPGNMRVKMYRWAKEAASRHRKQLADWHSAHLAYAAKRRSEASEKNV